MRYHKFIVNALGVVWALCLTFVQITPARAEVDINCSVNSGEQFFRLTVEDRKLGRRHLAVLSVMNVESSAVLPQYSPIQISAVKLRSDRSRRIAGISGRDIKVVLNLEALDRHVGDRHRTVKYDASGVIVATKLRELGFASLPIDCTVVKTGMAKHNQCPPDDEQNCEGDVNGDNVIDPLDVGYITTRLGCTPELVADCLTADLNGDSFVDPLDLGYLYARWDSCPAL